jgi:hypothetical protein
MDWLVKLGRRITGAEAREQRQAEAAAEVARAAKAQHILAEHEARDHFGADDAMSKLVDLLGEEGAKAIFVEHCTPRLGAAVNAALEDGLLSPEEEQRIDRVRQRYGGIGFGPDTQHLLSAAKAQYAAWAEPLAPINVPLLLKKGEWCVHAVKAVANEQRQRTVRVDYHGGQARVRLAKGLYYTAGSVRANRVSEAYYHSFGDGVLGATNSRLLWVSPEKSISIPLSKIVMFEPYTDGIKIIKDTGKPVLFVFDGEDKASMVRISRTIEELRP